MVASSSLCFKTSSFVAVFLTRISKSFCFISGTRASTPLIASNFSRFGADVRANPVLGKSASGTLE